MSAQSATPSRPYIGGQAVIEGVMMRGPKSFVVSVRRPDGQIAIREQAWNVLFPKLSFLRWPVFRGAVVLAESLHNGYSALTFSSEHGLPPEEGGAAAKPGPIATLTFLVQAIAAGADGAPGAPGPHAPKKDRGADAMLAIATVFMLGFFIGLPHLLTWGVGQALGPAFDSTSVAFHAIDGVFRVAILVGYLALISRTKDAKRLFEYHGAEHKAIWAYESQQALTVENARPFTTRHPRCGTSFLFIVVGVAVLLHVLLLPLLPRLHANDAINQLLMVLIKVPMAFPIAGLAFELQRLSARDNCPAVISWMTKPGIWLQGITTQPPDDAQQEIALLSLDRALAREVGAPKTAEGVTIYGDFARAAA
ncbi:MAG: DUF1385 domain-containing protein [Myxococcus sp.]|nr:DUF1385 domain-containing protein [Myxococcus sp.]